MPLEQARNAKEIDGRSDIYALGCTLYCLLVGHPPFTGRTLVEVIQAKEMGSFPPARQFNPDVTERLDLILAKMCAKLPKHRYQSCDEVIKDLETLGLASEQLEFIVRRPVGVKTPVPAAPTSSGDRTMITNEHEPDLWYVMFKTGEETVKRKYSTAQLMKMVSDGTVNGSAKACKTLNGSYRALATYKEFQSTALVKLTKKSADKNTSRYRNLYKQIEDKERKKESEKRASNPSLQVAKHWATIGLALGGAFGGILLLFAFLWWVASGLVGF
jgi:serine/threonine-protein kinase